MKKINVMHILPSLEIGGMENGVVNLVNGMDKNVFRPFVCCLEREGPLKEKLRRDVTVLNLRQKEGIRFLLPFQLSVLFKKHGISIVHTHNFYTSLYGIIGARIAHVPVIIHGEHGMLMQQKKRRKIIAGLLIRGTDCVTTVSEELEGFLVNSMGISKNRVVTIKNGVELAKFENSNCESLRSSLGLQVENLVIGSVGRMVPVKDHVSLISAFAQVNRIIPNTKLLLIGDGPLHGQLERAAKDSGVFEKTRFLGERSDIHDLLELMDVFVSASLSEGMSNVILEAMASKLPVVATQVGNNPQLISDGITGRLVPAQQPATLAKAIVDVLSDAKKAKTMGKSGYEFVKQNFSLEKMVKDYEDLYKCWFKNKVGFIC
jgi:sugar transferase (PEP-CTERM/EpsH1 system associated)